MISLMGRASTLPEIGLTLIEAAEQTVRLSRIVAIRSPSFTPVAVIVRTGVDGHALPLIAPAFGDKNHRDRKRMGLGSVAAQVKLGHVLRERPILLPLAWRPVLAVVMSRLPGFEQLSHTISPSICSFQFRGRCGRLQMSQAPRLSPDQPRAIPGLLRFGAD